MATSVPLLTIPNQELSMLLDGERYDIRLHAIGNGLSCIDIARNGEALITGHRCGASWYVLPYEYLGPGNFLWVTPAQAVPDWQLFGVSHFLDFIPQAELDALP